MQFLRFPILVQKEILGNLKLEDLVVLSSCSKRTNYSIQATEKPRLRKIKTIRYGLSDSESIDICAFSDTFSGVEMYIGIEYDAWERLDLTPMEVFGISRVDTWRPNTFSEKEEFDTVRRTFIIEGIHNCLLDLFGSSVNYEIRSYDRQLPPSLTNIKNSYIGSFAVTDAEKLEACFRNSPNQENIVLNGMGPLKLCQNSVINQTEYLMISCFETCGDDILGSFEGKSLNLISVHLQQASITKLLNDWKSDLGFRNLKFLSIRHSFNENWNIVKIMEDSGVRRLVDYSVLKWKERTMPTVLRGHNEWKERRIVTRKYVDRDSDGERAFVHISPREFYFVVGSSAEITNGGHWFNW
ncbi:hypothetical protein CRE_31066 [Caenorhabditis remanei]|uniref:Uncharacterized protein n=1 Tax=Caenorhabditis remanei TaxID=31234 RepID=E3LUF2_CAERE|nr:hypothetical protein CRE_31066 [Caenorhabditis remanei]